MSVEILNELGQRQRAVMFNQSIYQAYATNKWKFLEEIHPNETPGFMLSSPVPVFSATVAYILFVTIIGPLWMRSREPFNLKSTIRFYNLIEVFLAAYLMYNLHESVGSFGSFFNCTKAFTFADKSGSKVYGLANLIILVRLSEYIDTIFFTLRKKHNQVTFLHVFHHAFVPIYAYWILRTAPLRFNVYIIYINSAIHVLMYFYYFLATFQQRSQPGMEKSNNNDSILMSLITQVLRFKKYVTQLQILQFVSLNCYVLYAYLQPNSCNVPTTYIMANFLLASGFLGLFVHFYIRSYKQSQLARSQREAKRNR